MSLVSILARLRASVTWEKSETAGCLYLGRWVDPGTKLALLTRSGGMVGVQVVKETANQCFGLDKAAMGPLHRVVSFLRKAFSGLLAV